MKSKHILFFMACAGLITTNAFAEEIKYKFTAEQSVLNGIFIPGSDVTQAIAFDTLTGTISFDTDFDNSANNPNIAVHYTGDIEIDQFEYNSEYPTKVVITFDNIGNFTDAFNLFLQNPIDGERDEITFQLEDNDGTALDSTALPLELSLDEFERKNLVFYRFLDDARSVASYDIVALERIPNDSDGDGVSDEIDYCPDTTIPESAPTSGELGNARYALTTPNEFVFEGGGATKQVYSTTDTHGCSCTQIVAELGLGVGQLKKGCSTSTLEDWVNWLK